MITPGSAHNPHDGDAGSGSQFGGKVVLEEVLLPGGGLRHLLPAGRIRVSNQVPHGSYPYIV